MQAQFWLDRWHSGRIGFHRPVVDPNLERHWPTLEAAGGCGQRVFVPLCGKSLDMLWLRDRGHEVLGVELSAAALEAFCRENAVPARRRTRGDFDLYEAPGLVLWCGDFFGLTPAHLGDIAATYDRAALVAMAGPQRPRYAAHLACLIRPRAPLLLISLEYDQAQMEGPPFSVPAEEVQRLFAPYFRIRELGRRDILAEEPRFKARGVRALAEVCYHLERL